MVQMTVNYEGSLRCKVIHGPSGGTLHTDAPIDNNGKGEAASPTDLCAAALGSCIATIVGMRMEREGVDLAGMRIEVNKEMSPDLPRRITRLSTNVWIPRQLDEKQKRSVEVAARGCPVHHSLSPEIDKPIVFHWQP
ncbi:MAG: OsmC family protein [Opitutales bacterium]